MFGTKKTLLDNPSQTSFLNVTQHLLHSLLQFKFLVMNERLIIDLPTSLSASIITEWLLVKGRVRLDSAHCQASMREEFLQLTRSPELSVKSCALGKKNVAHRALVAWALLREVYVEKLSVEREGNLDLYNTYLQRFGSRVFAIHVKYSTIERLAQCIATCRNLLVLKIHNWRLGASLRDVFVFCERLQEFSGHSCISRRYNRDPNPSELPLISVHLESLVCNNLKYLELTNRDVDLIAAFLRMAVAVEVVVLKTEDIFLTGIPEKISLTASTLSLNEIILSAGLANFAPRGELLENLCFRSCDVTYSAISSLCSFPNLKALDLTGAMFENDDYLSVLAGNYGDKLTELLLYACNPSLPLVTVQEALPLFTKLKSFSLWLNDYITPVWNMSSFSGLTKLSIDYEGTNNSELVSQLTEHCHAYIRELSLCMVESDLTVAQVDILVSTCTKLRTLNLENINDNQLHYTDEEKARWKSLRPGLVVGGTCEHRLNVFDKYECSSTL